MPFSDSLAARMTAGDLAAIAAATSKAASRELCSRDYPEHRAEVLQLRRRRGGSCVDHRPHLVLRHQARQVRGRTQRAPVDLGQSERGVVGGHDDVGVADQTDAAAETEPVHRRDDRDGALVHRGESREATAVGADERIESLRSPASP